MPPSIVLVTGAAGFVGKHVISFLIENCLKLHSDEEDIVGTYLKYDKIIALDVCPPEAIAKSYNFCQHIAPLQLDLTKLVSAESAEFRTLSSILKDDNGGGGQVVSIIHIAGLVDTRESRSVQCRLHLVNVGATSALLDLASASADTTMGPRRFVYLSSSTAGMVADDTCHASRAAVPLCFRHLTLHRSLLSAYPVHTGPRMSSYGRSKRAAEDLLRQHVASGTGSLRVIILRPHVVFGLGDTMSTELMLGWPASLPHVLIGDPCAEVVCIRADNVGKYVCCADSALEKHPEVSGQVFHLGDAVIPLLGLHTRIVASRTPQGLTATFRHFRESKWSFKVERCAEGSHEWTFSHRVFVMPELLVFFLVLVAEILDHFVSPVFTHQSLHQFYRLMTANNFAYCIRNITTNPVPNLFECECASLYRLASANAAPSVQQTAASIIPGAVVATSSGRDMDWLFLNKTLLQRRLEESVRRVDAVVVPRVVEAVRPQGNTGRVVRSPVGTPFVLSREEVAPAVRVVLHNRVIKAATFECMCDSDGVPTDELVRYHARMAVGGVGLTLVAYACVSSDGRSFPTQICLNSASADIARRTQDKLRELCRQVHAAGGLVGIQLTHSGAFSDSKCNNGLPARGPSAILNPLTLRHSVPLTCADMERIERDFARATVLVRDLGFDAVEVHLGHGYLLSQCLSRHTCLPRDVVASAASFSPPLTHSDPLFSTPIHPAAKRLQFPLKVLTAVCRTAHNETGVAALDIGGKYLPVLVKFNVSEALESHLPLSDVIYFASAFYNIAKVDLLVPSGGHVMSNGLHMLRGGRPVAAMASAQRNWFKKLVIRHFGKHLIGEEPYREGFFRERTLSVMYNACIPLSRVCLVGGVHDVCTAENALGVDGFGTLMLGRVLLADPDWCIKVGGVSSTFMGQWRRRGPGKINVGVSDGKELGDSSAKDKSVCLEGLGPLQECDMSNQCIVGATMALTPLRCTKHANAMDW